MWLFHAKFWCELFFVIFVLVKLVLFVNHDSSVPAIFFPFHFSFFVYVFFVRRTSYQVDVVQKAPHHYLSRLCHAFQIICLVMTTGTSSKDTLEQHRFKVSVTLLYVQIIGDLRNYSAILLNQHRWTFFFTIICECNWLPCHMISSHYNK